MPRGKNGGGRYVSGGYITSTGRLYASKPGPKSSSSKSYYSSGNKSSYNNGGGGGHYIGSGYLTSTGRIYKSKPGPKSSVPTENDNYSFTNGYITSTGRLYKSKPGPKSKYEISDSRSLTNVLDNLSLNSNNYHHNYNRNYNLNNDSNYNINHNNYNSNYNQNDYHLQNPFRIRPMENLINDDNLFNINNYNFNRNDFGFFNFSNYDDPPEDDFNFIPKNKENDLDYKIKKYKIKVINTNKYLVNINKTIEEKKQEEDEKETKSGTEKGDLPKKKDEDNDNFIEPFKSKVKKNEIMKLKKNLSSNETKEIYKNENEEKKEKESLSESVVEVGKYEEVKCIICLGYFKINENIGVLKCEHYFHIDCIINWFDTKKDNKCPICKENN